MGDDDARDGHTHSHAHIAIGTCTWTINTMAGALSSRDVLCCTPPLSFLMLCLPHHAPLFLLFCPKSDPIRGKKSPGA